MEFGNLYGYSDITPYKVIKKTAKTLTLQSMKYERNPNWKPEIHAGGFMGNCSNQDQQEWIISDDPEGYTFKAHLRKDGKYHSVYGKHKLEDKPKRFYDYNF